MCVNIRFWVALCLHIYIHEYSSVIIFKIIQLVNKSGYDTYICIYFMDKKYFVGLFQCMKTWITFLVHKRKKMRWSVILKQPIESVRSSYMPSKLISNNVLIARLNTSHTYHTYTDYLHCQSAIYYSISKWRKCVVFLWYGQAKNWLMSKTDYIWKIEIFDKYIG